MMKVLWVTSYSHITYREGNMWQEEGTMGIS